MQRVAYEDLEFRGVMRLKGEPFTGVAFARFDDGRIDFERTYQAGIQSGPGREFFETELLAEECTMWWGMFHGERRQWHDNGQLLQEADYDAGLELRRTCWDEDGAVVDEYAFESDPVYQPGERLFAAYERLRAAWKELPRVPNDHLEYSDRGLYRSDGQEFSGIGYTLYDGGWLDSETEYRHGVKWGLERRWFAPGQLESEAVMYRGVLSGKQRRWHEAGGLAEEADFELGVRLRSTKWNPDGEVVETFELEESSTNRELLEKLRAIEARRGG